MSGKQYISSLEEKTSVHSVFLVREKNLQTGKTGKSYLSVVLGDRTGQLDGRIWDRAEQWDEEFEVDDFVEIKGFVQSFQNRKQMVINSLEVLPPSQISLSDFLPSSQRDPNEVFSELQRVISQVQNSYMKQLIVNTIEDPAIKPLFVMAPAAKTIHHAYIGGLMEHVLSICQIMVLLKSHYEFLDLDQLIFGAIFHDIGKIWELNFQTSIGYTDVGRLVGHIPLGSELVEKKSSEIPNFPFELKNICKHLVLSHHGKLEYGSPKMPMTLEAMIVNFVDDLDSKVDTVRSLIEADRASGEKWTRFSHLFERHFWIGPVLKPSVKQVDKE